MGRRGDELAEGLYESVVTDALLRRLAGRPDLQRNLGPVDDADAVDVLTRHLAESVRRGLASTRGLPARLELASRVLDALGDADADPADPLAQLLSLSAPPGPGRPAPFPTGRRPVTPLSDAALLTNAHGEPSVGSELRAELATSDAVDLLVAFVMWPGLRVLEAELRGLKERGVPFRVVTTTYLGGTEREALDRMVRDFGAQVRVQYDARRARLHAKAWLFRRRSGFDTAYVGSSNLSRAALLDGIEWNVRLSSRATPSLLDKFAGTFETYWNSDAFGPYDPDRDRDRLDDALAAARGGRTASGSVTLSGLEVRPYPYQQAMLDALASEREDHDRHRNLIVAATGTGKTVVAALDYRRLAAAEPGRRPSLLFVAHRGEILTQSLRTYREALVDPAFGELYVGGARPERWRHVFASVQSLTAYGVENIPADAFDVVVIDEFHHALASTYARLLDHLRPKELLGLTATPERGDGSDVRLLFGGRVAAELRLWDAINAGLLSPFHYFGVSDNTDLSRVAWRNGRYDEAALSGLYTGNTARAAVVLRQLRATITDPRAMRALGFCVSVDHARFMARVFTDAGVPAAAVSGQTDAAERADLLGRLRAGELNALFAADLLNEGIDIPVVDTVLFLRPTESPTVFLQQLGRGLRLAPEKDVLTVLDFVGQHRREFRLDLRYRALTGSTRTGLEHQVEKGFPFLPSGCEIVLDEVTQANVLASVREHLTLRWQLLVRELRLSPTDDLRQFLHGAGAELSHVVRQGKSWTQLRRAAGVLPEVAPEGEDALARRVRALVHVDDRARAGAYRRVLADPSGGLGASGGSAAADASYARMLFWTLWPDGGGFPSEAAGLARLELFPAVREEMQVVVDLAFDAARRPSRVDPDLLGGLPLSVHASYQREEVLAALGRASWASPPSHFREGVLAVTVQGRPVDAFFVTLTKSEADYSPSTMYRDYPISPTLFHWESQSTTSVASATGRRYLSGESTVLLFVRREQKNEFGTAPYTFLGPATYMSHVGDRPIAIVWRLQHAMPGDLFSDTSLAV